MIRLFRKEGDLRTLGILRDRASIPLIRAAVKSPDRSVSATAMAALASVPDRGAGPLLIPHLADRIEIQEGTPEGKFGSAGWALRSTLQPRDVPLLLEFLKTHDGLANAFALNLIGYFGTGGDIPKLKPFTEDRHERVREAAKNAIRRIRGELSKDTDRWMLR